jgi:hypothetical protein
VGQGSTVFPNRRILALRLLKARQSGRDLVQGGIALAGHEKG